jgi:hypothetical protein
MKNKIKIKKVTMKKRPLGRVYTTDSIGFKCTWMYVRQHVKSCHECQIRNTAKAHLSMTTPPPSIIFTKVHIDIMPMPPARGYQYIVLARDLSK